MIVQGPNSSPTKLPSKPSFQQNFRPQQKRPHSKPYGSSAYQVSSSSNGLKNSSQITRTPQSNYPEKRPDLDRHHSPNNYHYHHHNSHHHLNFKDKTSGSHNTLLVRLPNKNSALASKNQVYRPSYGSKPDSGNKEDESDLSAQETVHRPNMNSIDNQVRYVSKATECILGMQIIDDL